MFKLKKPHDRWKENFKTVKTWPSGTFLLYSFRSYDPTKATFSVVVVEYQVSRGCHLRCSYLGEKTCKYQKRYDRWKENSKPVKTWPCGTRSLFSFRSYGYKGNLLGRSCGMIGNCTFLLLMVISQPKRILNKKSTWPWERFFQALQNLTKREFLALFV